MLSLGIPVVTLPMGADQPDNSDRCAELGVGITLDPLSVTPAEIAASARTVLDDPEFHAAAATLGDEAATQMPLDAVPELRELLFDAI